MTVIHLGLRTRPPVAEPRLKSLADGRYEYTPKKGVSFTVTAQQLIRRPPSTAQPSLPLAG